MIPLPLPILPNKKGQVGKGEKIFSPFLISKRGKDEKRESQN
jgi:hypothetical protein